MTALKLTLKLKSIYIYMLSDHLEAVGSANIVNIYFSRLLANFSKLRRHEPPI